MNSNQLIGVGLKTPHYKEIIEDKPSIGWFEVHSENFFFEGGNALKNISRIAENYPISLHGIGLSLGSADGIQEEHLQRLKMLIDRINPCFVSEHLSWGHVAGVYMPDLLSIPYTSESLDIFCKNIDITQNFLGREIFIENPSSYIEYKISQQEESEFLVELCKRSGAKILFDVNNLFVSASNHGWDSIKYIDSIPKDLIKEIHLAGHMVKVLSSNQEIRVDTHNDYVCQEVWDLYAYVIKKFGPVPTLLEWDADIPSLDILISEASKALKYLLPEEKR
jgi:uncharacterized protein